MPAVPLVARTGAVVARRAIAIARLRIGELAQLASVRRKAGARSIGCVHTPGARRGAKLALAPDVAFFAHGAKRADRPIALWPGPSLIAAAVIIGVGVAQVKSIEQPETGVGILCETTPLAQGNVGRPWPHARTTPAAVRRRVALGRVAPLPHPFPRCVPGPGGRV